MNQIEKIHEITIVESKVDDNASLQDYSLDYLSKLSDSFSNDFKSLDFTIEVIRPQKEEEIEKIEIIPNSEAQDSNESKIIESLHFPYFFKASKEHIQTNVGNLLKILVLKYLKIVNLATSVKNIKQQKSQLQDSDSISLSNISKERKLVLIESLSNTINQKNSDCILNDLKDSTFSKFLEELVIAVNNEINIFKLLYKCSKNIKEDNNESRKGVFGGFNLDKKSVEQFNDLSNYIYEFTDAYCQAQEIIKNIESHSSSNKVCNLNLEEQNMKNRVNISEQNKFHTLKNTLVELINKYNSNYKQMFECLQYSEVGKSYLRESVINAEDELFSLKKTLSNKLFDITGSFQEELISKKDIQIDIGSEREAHSLKESPKSQIRGEKVKQEANITDSDIIDDLKSILDDAKSLEKEEPMSTNKSASNVKEIIIQIKNTMSKLKQKQSTSKEEKLNNFDGTYQISGFCLSMKENNNIINQENSVRNEYFIERYTFSLNDNKENLHNEKIDKKYPTGESFNKISEVKEIHRSSANNSIIHNTCINYPKQKKENEPVPVNQRKEREIKSNIFSKLLHIDPLLIDNILFNYFNLISLLRSFNEKHSHVFSKVLDAKSVKDGCIRVEDPQTVYQHVKNSILVLQMLIKGNIKIRPSVSKEENKI